MEPIDEASVFFKGALIWGKRAAGARSSMKRLLVRPRASVSSIRTAPWACEVNSNRSVRVICEPSGDYERALLRALVGAQLKISLVPANRVRQFARAAGILAKTDRIDAKLLCAFGEAIEPGTISASQLEQQHLRELESQRRHLTHLLGSGRSGIYGGWRSVRHTCTWPPWWPRDTIRSYAAFICDCVPPANPPKLLSLPP